MPRRQLDDGSVGVRRLSTGYLELSTDGSGDVCSGKLVVSPYNAARLFGMLSLFLEIPLPAALASAIKLTEPGQPLNATYAFPEPKTLGERLAQGLIAKELGEAVVAEFDGGER